MANFGSEQTPTRRSVKALAICVAAVALLAAMDLVSKSWALDRLSLSRVGEAPPLCDSSAGGYAPQRIRTAPIVLVDNYLEFRYAENCGAAFGLLRDAPKWARQVVFASAALLASVFLLGMYAQGRGSMLFLISVPMIIAGAVGNLWDRVRYGYVVDFIRFHWQERWEYPTFNIADIWITVGVVLLILDGLLEGRQLSRAKANPAAAAAHGDEA